MAVPAGYVGILDILTTTARDCGYALGLHGSLKKDMDIMAMPWMENACSGAELVHKLHQSLTFLRADVAMDNYTEALGTGRIDGPAIKPHGRRAWNIYLGVGCYLDISVMPRSTETDETIIPEQDRFVNLLTDFGIFHRIHPTEEDGRFGHVRLSSYARTPAFANASFHPVTGKFIHMEAGSHPTLSETTDHGTSP